jgi:hypothetical protein
MLLVLPSLLSIGVSRVALICFLALLVGKAIPETRLAQRALRQVACCPAGIVKTSTQASMCGTTVSPRPERAQVRLNDESLVSPSEPRGGLAQANPALKQSSDSESQVLDATHHSQPPS